jgi:hypothetical protein
MRKSSPDWRCVGLMQSAVALPVSRACPARTLRFAHPPAAQRRDVGSAGWQPPWLRAAEQHGSWRLIIGRHQPLEQARALTAG